MKKFLVCLLCCCFLLVPTQIHASSSHILIRSQQIPYLFLIDVVNDEKLIVYIFPEDLYLPNEHDTLLSIKKETTTQVQSRIETSYQIPVESYVEVHLDQVDEDFDRDLNNYDMTSMHGITQYFEDLKDQLSIQDLLHYQRYITSDLTLNDYYRYYRMFQHTVKIDYIYASYFEVDGHKYPMTGLPHMT